MKIITITREDITKPMSRDKDGLKNLVDDCPLARGLNAAFSDRKFTVGVSTYIETSSPKWVHRKLPSLASKFRERFDRGGWFMRKWLIWQAPWQFEFPEL